MKIHSIMHSVVLLFGCLSFGYAGAEPVMQAAKTAPKAAEKAAEKAELKFRLPEMIAIPGKNFELGKYEVTQAEWQVLMEGNPSNFKGANLPVESVSWKDIQEYLVRLNQKTGKKFRLPKEAEWEYACLAGNKTEYCGSNDPGAVAWYGENSGHQTHPVGQKRPNGYGLYDMSGNVREWLDDCWEGNCTQRLIRGGSWASPPELALMAKRNGRAATDRIRYSGFRLARTLP